MKKIEFGLFALLIIIGNQFGSVFGIGLAVCIWMIATGLSEEIAKRPRKNKMDSKKEESK